MRPTAVVKVIAVWAAAIIAVSTIVSWVSSHAWSTAIGPVLDAIAEERHGRISADSMIVRRLEIMSRDRLDLMDVMLAPTTKLREEKLASIRKRWLAER